MDNSRHINYSLKLHSELWKLNEASRNPNIVTNMVKSLAQKVVTLLATEAKLCAVTSSVQNAFVV